MNRIMYGRLIRNGVLVGYCSYIDENGKRVEIISPPYGKLEVYINGKKVEPTEEHVMIWTMVASWLGEEEIIKKLKVK